MTYLVYSVNYLLCLLKTYLVYSVNYLVNLLCMLVWGLWFTVTTLVLGLCLWSQVVIDTKNIVFWYV